MKRLILLVAIAMMVPADATQARFSTETVCQILLPCLPPAQYASGPFLAKPVVHRVTLRQVQTACGGGYAAFLGDKAVQAVTASGETFDFGILGCAQLNASECTVHVPSDVQAKLPELYRVVLAHELAHCRGWVHQRY